MRLKRIGFALLVSCASVTTGTLARRPRALSQEVSATTPATREIQMTAKKYEFNPSVITVTKGERVKLIITATDRDHGFKLDAFRINQRLKKGEPTTVEFTADRAGEFPFQCSVVCGMGHHKMKGKLVVQGETN